MYNFEFPVGVGRKPPAVLPAAVVGFRAGGDGDGRPCTMIGRWFVGFVVFVGYLCLGAFVFYRIERKEEEKRHYLEILERLELKGKTPHRATGGVAKIIGQIGAPELYASFEGPREQLMSKKKIKTKPSVV